MTAHAVQYDGSPRTHVESIVIKATAPDNRHGLWLSAGIVANDEQAQVHGWAIAFHEVENPVAAKHVLPVREATLDGDGLALGWALKGGSNDRLAISPTQTAGQVTTNRNRIAWALELSSRGDAFRALPFERLYTARWGWKAVTPGPNLRISGDVEVNGKRWKLDRWHGLLGHRWGEQRPEEFAWAHCNQWNEPEDLVFEASTAKTRTGRLSSPALTTICMRHAGRDYHFNGPLQMIGTRARIGMRRYGLKAESRMGKLDAVFDARPHDLAGVHHPNPDGSVTHGLHALLAHARIRFEPHDGHPIALSSRAAALQIGTSRSDHGVTMIL